MAAAQGHHFVKLSIIISPCLGRQLGPCAKETCFAFIDDAASSIFENFLLKSVSPRLPEEIRYVMTVYDRDLYDGGSALISVKCDELHASICSALTDIVPDISAHGQEWLLIYWTQHYTLVR